MAGDAAAAVKKEEKKDEPKKKTGDKKKDKKDKDENDDLSPEDQKLKADLDLMAERALDKDAGVQKMALESMVKEIRTSTSSMTSVPKPLKFLRPHFPALKAAFGSSTATANKKLMADVLSVLAMTMGNEGERESLRFKLQGSIDDIGSWGHEYVRNLAGEIGAEHEELSSAEGGADKGKLEELLGLVRQIVPFFIQHNSDPEAIDLLMEVDLLPELVGHVEESNWSRIALYLEQISRYVPEPEDAQVVRVAIDALRKVGKTTEAVRLALIAGDTPLVVELINSCEDECAPRAPRRPAKRALRRMRHKKTADFPWG